MTVRVAIAQARPVFLDLRGTLDRTRELVGEAAALGAELVAFPESWLPGYPAWLDVSPGAALWDEPAAKRVHRRLIENSVEVPGRVVDVLADLAREHEVVLVVGVHERVRGTLFNTVLTFDADGRLARHHRKLVPTFTERLIWGRGDGEDMPSVETAVGRVGALICWEHWMPPTRQVMHESDEQIHVAQWPWVKDMHVVASRHYAFEGRTFVLAAGGILHRDDLPSDLPAGDDAPELLCRGGSLIVAPDGAIVAGPVLDEETILTADLDLGRIAEESLTLDVTGHYARPDLFDLRVRTGDAT